MKHSPVSTRKPDDVILQGSIRDPAIILQAGEVHWAYMSGQRNNSNVARPLVVDPLQPGTDRFDSEWLAGRVVICRIDGSAKALVIDPLDNSVQDSSGHSILSSEADAWIDSGEHSGSQVLRL